MCRVPTHFYVEVWDVMSRTPQGITVQGSHLPQQPTLSNMTQSELNFALLVEEMLNHIQKPEYRQTVVEVSTFYKFITEVIARGFILRQHVRTLIHILRIHYVRHMEPAQDHVQYQALVLAVLNIWILFNSMKLSSF